MELCERFGEIWKLNDQSDQKKRKEKRNPKCFLFQQLVFENFIAFSKRHIYDYHPQWFGERKIPLWDNASHAGLSIEFIVNINDSQKWSPSNQSKVVLIFLLASFIRHERCHESWTQTLNTHTHTYELKGHFNHI